MYCCIVPLPRFEGGEVTTGGQALSSICQNRGGLDMIIIVSRTDLPDLPDLPEQRRTRYNYNCVKNREGLDIILIVSRPDLPDAMFNLPEQRLTRYNLSVSRPDLLHCLSLWYATCQLSWPDAMFRTQVASICPYRTR